MSDEKSIYNFVYDEGKFDYVKNHLHGGHYSGTGDIMASIITGKLASGKDLFCATKIAADFVATAVKQWVEDHLKQQPKKLSLSLAQMVLMLLS